MIENKSNETFLSDWIVGRISDAELKQLVSEADFLAFRKLKKTLENHQVAYPDMEMNFAAIKAKRKAQSNQRPSRIFILYRYGAVAAAFALMFALYQLFIFTNSLATDFGKTAVVALDDHSHVTLNAKSKISYPNFFTYNRTIKLDGEAFFEVAKGNTFTVKTPQGEVQVLGTKFNVIARPGFFEVVCLEGRVKVCANSIIEILTHGNAVRFYENKLEKWDEMEGHKPLWITGESTFKNAPLQLVVSLFQNQYNYEVQYPKEFSKIRFSGSFTNKNSDVALQSICIPLNLKYTKTNTGKIIISK